MLLCEQLSNGQHCRVLEYDIQRQWLGWDSQNGEQQEQATAHPADDPVGQAPVMLQHINQTSAILRSMHNQPWLAYSREPVMLQGTD